MYSSQNFEPNKKWDMANYPLERHWSHSCSLCTPFAHYTSFDSFHVSIACVYFRFLSQQYLRNHEVSCYICNCHRNLFIIAKSVYKLNTPHLYINVAIILLQKDKMKMDQSEMESYIGVALVCYRLPSFGTWTRQSERNLFDQTIQRFTFYLNFRKFGNSFRHNTVANRWADPNWITIRFFLNVLITFLYGFLSILSLRLPCLCLHYCEMGFWLNWPAEVQLMWPFYMLENRNENTQSQSLYVYA